MTAAIGTLGRLALNGVEYDFISEALAMDEGVIDANGVRGTRSRNITRVRSSLQRIAGTIALHPNAVELQNLLALMCGGSTSGSPTVTYALGNTLSSFTALLDRVVKVYTMAGCVIDKATFRCGQGDPLMLDLDVVGQTQSIGNAGTFGSTSVDVATGPWTFSDLVFSLNSVTITSKSVELTIDNHVDRDRFFNGLTASALPALDRTVTLKTTIPYGDWSALYAAGLQTTGFSGVPTVLTFTNGNAVLTITLPKLVFPRKGGNIPGRQEIMMDVEGQAFQTSAFGDEIAISLNPGP